MNSSSLKAKILAVSALLASQSANLAQAQNVLTTEMLDAQQINLNVEGDVYIISENFKVVDGSSTLLSEQVEGMANPK